MSERARRLERLLAIRQLREEMDRYALAKAEAEVAEVGAAMRAQERQGISAQTAARTALGAGDRGQWLLADAQGEVAGWNRGRLAELRASREMSVGPAIERFMESRRESEQARVLVDAAALAAREEEDRRAQAAADERFLALRGRQRVRAER